MDWTLVQGIAKDFFVPLVGAAAGAWATLEVFNRQTKAQSAEIARTVREDNEKQDNQADRNLSHFVWLLEDLIKVATVQNQDYLDTAKQIEKRPMMPHYFITRASGTLTRILSLNQDDIFFSFIRKGLDTETNRRHVTSVYKNVDLIHQIITSVKHKYEGHLEEYSSLASEYREVVEEVRDLIIERTTNAKKSYSIHIDPLATYLAETSKNYLRDLTTLPEASDLDWQHEQFLWPLQKTIVEEFDYDDRMVAIANKGRRGLILIGRIRFSSASTVQSINQDSTTLAQAIENLQKDIDYIKALLATTQPRLQALIRV